MPTKQLLIKCRLPLGDNVLLTAAVRDLHLSYPKRFATVVESSVPEIWEHNPKVLGAKRVEENVEVIDFSQLDIENCNIEPYHYLHAYIDLFNVQLGLQIKPTAFKGDVYLSVEERQWCSQVQELLGADIPYWIIVTGGKRDVTTKWWPVQRYQEVVDHFRGKIQFVQVGDQSDHHPPLRGVIDLRGKTDVRQLIRLVYHADGVLCPITSLMHLAAAVEPKDSRLPYRPCVVIAGGREPSQWEAYPNHQFIHTNGSLLCCDQGGCWKSRTRPLRDGLEFDRPENLCLSPVGDTPRCMDIISSRQVIRRIELYFQGGTRSYLTEQQLNAIHSVLDYGNSVAWSGDKLAYYINRNAAEEYIATLPPYPHRFSGRGIVICGGGTTYFTNAWVCINILRKLGCKLPIQLWHLGPKELDGTMKELMSPLNVKCVDANEINNKDIPGIANGWSLKSHALLHSPFKEVLLLDADNVPTIDPEYLFAAEEFKNYGAVFWPDLERFAPDHPVWELFAVPYQNEPQFESGQMLINKEQAWPALLLAAWYNQRSDLYYQYLYGDKDTYHMAFRKLQINYAMPQSGTVYADGVLYQHDFQGRRIFQHRYRDKWSLWIPNKHINGFALEEDCRACLRVLRESWNGRITNGNGKYAPPPSFLEAAVSKELTTHRYELCIAGKPPRTLSFALDGKIDGLRRDESWSWNLQVEGEKISLKILAGATLAGELERKNKRHWISCIGEPASLRRISNKSAKDHILLRASVNTYTGYGLHAVAIISGLTRQGYDLQIAPIGFDEKFSSIPESIKNRISHTDDNGNWELLLYPPNKKPTPSKKTVYLTMWETTRIPQQYISYLNMAECLIVPCRWNVENFTAQGVSRPIYQVPLGIYTNIYKYSPMLLDGPCIFGTAGRLASGGIRKGLDKVIDAFREAFPVEQDVRLYVKAFSDCPLPETNDPRIVILQKYLTDQEMAAWYRSITCFVSASSGEAWGLMQHQAMATGRPIISVDYGGVKEFFNKYVGYPLDYKLVSADKFYANCGVWAEPSHESLIEQMREVYTNREKADFLGKLGAEQVSGLSWKSSNQKLAQVLRHIGMCR